MVATGGFSAGIRYFEFSPDGKSLFLSVKTGDRVTGKLQWDRYPHDDTH